MSEFEELIRQKAVALKYNPDKNGAPVIVASGMGYLAERITETAMEAGVPVYEDDSLATLLTQLQLGAEIPQELYQAIVDIYLYFLALRSGSQASPPPRSPSVRRPPAPPGYRSFWPESPDARSSLQFPSQYPGHFFDQGQPFQRAGGRGPPE